MKLEIFYVTTKKNRLIDREAQKGVCAPSCGKVSDILKNAAIGVMYAASNEAEIGFDGDPDIAKASSR